ncbi:MAG TPA: O-antigen ligase family protein [Acidimicrobiales bacterium]|nr:O-antigen ligase family protein [Acidimicrobiales bacterium]
MIVFFLPLAWRRQRWRAVVAIALVLLLASGSRAAGIAVAAETLVLAGAFQRRVTRWFLRFVITAVLVAGGWLLIQSDGMSTVVEPKSRIFRSDNSRAEQWQGALEAGSSRSVVGVGLDAYEFDAASSYFKALADLGFIGVAASAVAVRGAWRHARGSSAMRAAAVGGLTNAVFESWLFAGGSLFAVLFWLIMESAPSHDRDT